MTVSVTLTNIDNAGNERADHLVCVQQVARQQCRASFGKLFEYYAPRLKSYLKRMGAEDSHAEEIVQDVMLTVWRKAEQFDESRASVSTWIFRIARNRQIDLYRQTSRPELSAEEPMLQPAAETPPEESLSRDQIDANVRRQLDMLPAEQLDLLRAAFYDGLSHSEIARTHGLPLGTVKSRIRLAFDRLRLRIKPD